MESHLKSHFPAHTVKSITEGKKFYVPTFGLTLIHIKDNLGLIVLFPETAIYYNIPQDEVDLAYIECKKENNSMILLEDQNFNEKSFIILDRNFFQRIDIQDAEIFKIKVNLKFEDFGLTLLRNSSDILSYEDNIKLFSLHELHCEIQNLILTEDYEKMVIVRDEIKNRTNH